MTSEKNSGNQKTFKNNFYPWDGVVGTRRVDGQEKDIPPVPGPVEIPGDISVYVSPPGPVDNDYSTADAVFPGPMDSVPPCQPGILRTGCYYIRYIPPSVPTPPEKHYEGTLRVQKTGTHIMASGDLYRRKLFDRDSFCAPTESFSNGKHTIPVFPRNQYAFYFRLTRILEISNNGRSMAVHLESFHFEQKSHEWMISEPIRVELRYCITTDGTHYWDGDVKTDDGLLSGRFIMTWIAPFFRQAVLEIDKTKDAEFPREFPHDDKDGAARKKITWKNLFREVGWDIEVIESHQELDPKDNKWRSPEIHDAMMRFRDSHDLDSEWRYHLLTVGHFERDKIFGIMYDESTKGNKIPREGAAVAYNTPCPNYIRYGDFRKKPFHTAGGAFFRTAVHEIGHAMMLRHPRNPRENHIMQITDNLARYPNVHERFPNNIKWCFSPKDHHLLCHLPDIAIRPGGLSFRNKLYAIPISERDEVLRADGLELEVNAQHDLVPIGAPIRINFKLKNVSGEKKEVPGSLSIKTGGISGYVIEPTGTSQDFSTIVHSIGDITTEKLEKNEEKIHSVTLLWGAKGPLFPSPGFYRIVIEVEWTVDGTRVQCCGSTGIMVSAPKDDKHARAALTVFSNPDILVTLAVGGDHMKEGNEIIEKAIENPTLKPHFNILKAKRYGMRFFSRDPNLAKACDIIEDDKDAEEETVMSHAEVYRMAKILSWSKDETPTDVQQRLADVLMKKAKKVDAEDRVEDVLKKLDGIIVKRHT